MPLIQDLNADCLQENKRHQRASLVVPEIIKVSKHTLAVSRSILRDRLPHGEQWTAKKEAENGDYVEITSVARPLQRRILEAKLSTGL